MPFFSPSLSRHWVGVVTPVPAAIARPPVESLRNTVVCDEHDIARWIPDPPGGLLGFDDAVRLALQRVREAALVTRSSSASVPGAPSDPLPTDPDRAGGSRYVDERVRVTTAEPGALWRVIEGIGGESGWYSFPLARQLRGRLDRLVGGVGLRRGRRDPRRLYVGGSLDFRRVEEVREGRLVRLRAEMRLPVWPWLEFHVEQGVPRTGIPRTGIPRTATTAARGCGRRRRSTPAACWAARTGGRRGRSTRSSSAHGRNLARAAEAAPASSATIS